MSSLSIKAIFAFWRAYLVLFVMFLCVLVVAWKLSHLHITERDFLQDQGNARTIRTVPLVANRGLITDRNGEPLAVSTPVQSIWVDPRKIVDNSENIKTLAKKLELNEDVLTQNLKNKSNLEFLYIKRRLPPSEAMEILNLNLEGVYSQQEYQRQEIRVEYRFSHSKHRIS